MKPNIPQLKFNCFLMTKVILYIMLHYSRVTYSGLSTRLLSHYYTFCTVLETENS